MFRTARHSTPLKARASSSDEQERWALTLIREVWPHRYLLFGWVGREGPVLLDHTSGKPIRRTRAFIQVAVDGPRLTTRGTEGPLRIAGSEVLHISPGVGDRRVLSGRPAPRQHSVGNINAQDVCRSLLSRPTAEPAETAAKVQDVEPAQVRKQSTERRPFRSTVQAFDRTAQPAVSLEELLVVIDVLRHRTY